MRIVLDSNVIIATFASRGICADILLTCSGKYSIIIGPQIVEEVRRNFLSKLKFEPELAMQNEETILEVAEMVRPAEVSDVECRDQSDVGIIAIAVSGKAEIIVTGDADLIEVGTYKSIRILSPRAFWELLSKDERFA